MIPKTQRFKSSLVTAAHKPILDLGIGFESKVKPSSNCDIDNSYSPDLKLSLAVFNVSEAF